MACVSGRDPRTGPGNRCTSREDGMPRCRGTLVTFVVLLAVGAPARAQTAGSIVGKTVDGSGAAVVGVTVTVAGTNLQQPLTTVTTKDGTYRFPIVPIGAYAVTYVRNGFKKTVRE